MSRKNTSVHRFVHRNSGNNFTFTFLKKLYTPPKIYRHKKDVNGKKVVSLEGYWCVYYYFRHPETGVMTKFAERQGINKLKTIALREAAAQNVKKVLTRLLQEGYNPFVEKQLLAKEKKNVNKSNFNIVEAVELAYEQKKNSWKESTKDVNKSYLESFSVWLKKRSLHNLPVQDLSKKHISFYLDHVLKNSGSNSNTTRNNHRRFLSSMFTELVEKEIVNENIVQKIPLLKSKSKKNKPFTNKQLIDILNYTKANEPYLYQFIKVMWYSFLRPIEIVRLEVRNVNLDDNVIDIETKTEARAYIRIVKPLQVFFKNKDLKKYAPTMFVFGKDNSVGYWETKKVKSREDFFIRRFKKIKDHFGLSSDYGIYSFRHTAALSLYYQFIKEGLSEYQAVLKIQDIMRHKDQQVTRKYLREIGGQLPEDWSDKYDYELV
ncbi:Site-specific recombinase XerD [Tenacibaculum sp. 190130A14a]|uniref:Site-specific recombinase XerD n=1 Tax=Tenacibaculum polynesiense TaxID=3137857 RepID=A0ABP1F4C9_9FLAO